MRERSVGFVMLSPGTVEAVETYWASFFGCSRDTFHSGSCCVVSHGPALADYHGIFIFVRGGSRVVSLPPNFAPQEGTSVESWTIATARDRRGLARRLGVAECAVIGPAMLSYAEAGSLRRVSASARMLTEADANAVTGLREVCPALEWEHGGCGAGAVMGGVFEGGKLVALAGYEVWGGVIAQIAAITHPAFRNRGLGQDAVSTIALHATNSCLVPQYRTLESNIPSMAVAASGGSVPLAATTAIRLV
jgi:hypothetical protein